MPYFVYPKGSRYASDEPPRNPTLIYATFDLEEAIRVANKNNATIEKWENAQQVIAIEYE